MQDKSVTPNVSQGQNVIGTSSTALNQVNTTELPSSVASFLPTTTASPAPEGINTFTVEESNNITVSQESTTSFPPDDSIIADILNDKPTYLSVVDKEKNMFIPIFIENTYPLRPIVLLSIFISTQHGADLLTIGAINKIYELVENSIKEKSIIIRNSEDVKKLRQAFYTIFEIIGKSALGGHPISQKKGHLLVFAERHASLIKLCKKHVIVKGCKEQLNTVFEDDIRSSFEGLYRCYYALDDLINSEIYCRKLLDFLPTCKKVDREDLMAQYSLTQGFLAEIYLEWGYLELVEKNIEANAKVLSQLKLDSYPVHFLLFCKNSKLAINTLNERGEYLNALKILRIAKSTLGTHVKNATQLKKGNQEIPPMLAHLTECYEFFINTDKEIQEKYLASMLNTMKNSASLKALISKIQPNFGNGQLKLIFKESDYVFYFQSAFYAKGLSIEKNVSQASISVDLNGCPPELLKEICENVFSRIESARKEEAQSKAMQEPIAQVPTMQSPSPTSNTSPHAFFASKKTDKEMQNKYLALLSNIMRNSYSMKALLSKAQPNFGNGQLQLILKESDYIFYFQPAFYAKGLSIEKNFSQGSISVDLNECPPELLKGICENAFSRLEKAKKEEAEYKAKQAQNPTIVKIQEYHWLKAGLYYRTDQKNQGIVKVLTHPAIPKSSTVWFGYIPDWVKQDLHYSTKFEEKLINGIIGEDCIRDIRKQVLTMHLSVYEDFPYRFKIIIDGDFRLYGWIDDTAIDEQGRVRRLVCFGYVGHHKTEHLPNPATLKAKASLEQAVDSSSSSITSNATDLKMF